MSKEMIELADEIESLAALDAHAGVGALCARSAGAIVAALRASAVAEPMADKLQESSFRAGLKLGWNLAGDEAAFKRAMDAHSWDEIAASGLYAHPEPAAPVQNAVKAACDRVNDLIADLEGEHAAMAGRPLDAENWKLEVPVTDLRVLCRAALGSSPAAPVPASVREALEAIKAAHASMFAQCCSNSITNAWGKQVDVSALNEALRLAEIALASLPAPEAAPTREEYAAVLAQELWCGATFADAAPSEREAFLRAVDAILALKAAPAK